MYAASISNAGLTSKPQYGLAPSILYCVHWCAEKVAGIEQRIKRQGRGAIRIGGVFVDDAKYGHIESYRCIDHHGIRLEHIQGNEIAVNGRARRDRAGTGAENVNHPCAFLVR